MWNIFFFLFTLIVLFYDENKIWYPAWRNYLLSSLSEQIHFLHVSFLYKEVLLTCLDEQLKVQKLRWQCQDCHQEMGKQMCCLLHHTQRHDTSQYYNLGVPTRQSNEMISLFVLTGISCLDFSRLLESQTSLKQKVS